MATRSRCPSEHKFIGFDAYQKAMDCLKPGDVVIFATPPAFRWVHFTYAIQKGIHTFMEKPITVDGPTTRRMLALAEEAKKKSLKVGVGLMCRHCEARGELFSRIKDGEIGDLLMLRAYRQTGPVGSALTAAQTRWHQRAALPDQEVPRLPLGQRRLLQRLPDPQHRRMLLDEGRLAGLGQGLRRPRAIEATASTRTSTPTRSSTPSPTAPSCSWKGGTSTAAHQEFASYAHGSKGSAVISSNSHSPARCRIYKGQKFTRGDVVWAFPQPEPNPYQVEWDDLIHAIKKDKLYNEVKRGAEASLVTSMGRMAAHTGQIITFDEMLNCKSEFAPDVDKLTMTSPAPLADG